MNNKKSFTYSALGLGVTGLILQILILNKGDDSIKMDALSGDLFGQ